ncbi:DNA-directed RNA polymerase I subunit RPA1, partial [Stegodyphus mimosarum]
MMKSFSKCPHCRTPRKKMALYKTRIVCTEGRVKLESEKDRGNKEITPEKARDHMYILWKNQKDILQCLYKILVQEEKKQNVAVDIFFLSSIIVPPSRFRPLIVMKGKKYADQQTLKFKDILSDCKLIQNIWRFAKNVDIDENEKALINKIPGKSEGDKFNYVYQSLQRHVAELFDCEQSKENFSKGIKQILEKKEGLFRMNMMGKRVNYAARSVISPDPYIKVNEIGIPLVFAKKLTFPEPASQWNFEKLRQAVKNGPDIYPGASLIQKEDGKIVKLTGDPTQREALSKLLLTQQGNVIGGVKIVHRHIQDGDMLLLNRQPTLHKPSIMAHKARVLPGEKTLRLHYANCKAYNADFDGDEMNAHLPQTYGGQAECRHIVNVNHQYLVPKDGTPLSGLIQDHIIAGTLLTMRGRFFDRNDYEKLIYSALTFTRKRLKLLPPCIWKPEVLWSGKQVVSSIIINLIPEDKLPPTLEGKAKVSSKNWVREPVREWKAGGTPLSGDNMSESEVIIRSGELLCGVIDKAQIGPTPYSLIHVCYELYGGEISSVILTALARLFTHYLQFCSGFTLGIKDIVLTPKADKKRRKVLKKTKAKGLIACSNALEVENPEENIEELLTKYKETHFNRDDFGLKVVDMEMKKVTHELNNKINTICIPEGLKSKFPLNNLQLMVESGAKGSSVNAMQISCLLGQIELEGRRMPLMLNGCTLPSFPAYDTSPEAGGFVTGRFLSSINPQEYFFHCMAGREGLIDTAVKTSRSGYLQRCLIKHLEGVTVNYDLTVRDSDGSIVQFLYGEDGMDVGKMQLLKENQFHLLAKNYDALINKEHLKMLLDRKDSRMEKQKRKVKKWQKKHSSSEPRSSLINKIEIAPAFSDLKKRVKRILNEKENIDEYVKKKFKRKHGRCPDPVSSKFKPDVTFGSVTEKLDSAISDYIARNPHGLLHYDTEDISGKLSTEKFQDLCYYRAMKSLAEPGEAVGLLAAQSIGEPSTQMTLNTFHFAGKGEMNVTLGIPRIREILMTASANIATPTMDLPLLDKPGIEEEAENLRLQLAPVSLKEILEAIEVKEYISV